jgi:hypothetical protein
MKYIILLLVTFVLTSCTSKSTEDKRSKYSDIKIHQQGQSLDSDKIIANACKEFTLNKSSVYRFFNQSHSISEIELHNEYDILPCYSEGSLVLDGKPYSWRIRAGGTGVLSNENEVINKACSEKACSNIPNLH